MNKSRILIVDDDQNLSDLVRFFLNKTQRFEVCVENRAAHAVAAALNFQPDLVLLDVDMPGKDGGAVAAEMGEEPTLGDTQIIFLTSMVSRSEAGESLVTRGGLRFLAKPVNPKALIETLDRVLQVVATAA